MNAIFLLLISLSLIICLFTAPEKALPAMLNGANKSLTLLFTLASVYCVWMGVYNILESANVTKFFSKLLKKPIKKLFKESNEECVELISLNLASNMLGLGGVATPLGIKACALMQNSNNNYGAKLLVVISATSIQLLPTSVISLANGFGAQNSESLIFPTFLCTLFSTTFAVFLFILTENITIKLKGKNKESKALTIDKKPSPNKKR